LHPRRFGRHTVIMHGSRQCSLTCRNRGFRPGWFISVSWSSGVSMRLRDRFLGFALRLIAVLLLLPAASGQNAAPPSANRPARVEWFLDQGFGMFIHWSVDGQLGG